jgi:hypothetical protein
MTRPARPILLLALLGLALPGAGGAEVEPPQNPAGNAPRGVKPP